MTERVYFFGVWGAGQSGHYLYTSAGQTLWMSGDASPVPWLVHELDGGLTWNAGEWVVNGANRWRKRATSAEVQGEAALHHKAGWTALAWWDFTGDRRGASNSVVFVDRLCGFDEILSLFAAHFPAPSARQTGFKLVVTTAAPQERDE